MQQTLEGHQVFLGQRRVRHRTRVRRAEILGDQSLLEHYAGFDAHHRLLDRLAGNYEFRLSCQKNVTNHVKCQTGTNHCSKNFVKILCKEKMKN